MADQFELKTLGPDAVPSAIERAEHYRLLNDPVQAESICLDVLAVDAGNQEALVQLILAITDQFGGGSSNVSRARKLLKDLTDEYHQVYYPGIVAEREARSFLAGPARAFAYESFVEAMDWYEKAAALNTWDAENAKLRWNSCARTIMNERLEPRPEDPEVMLE